MREIYVVHQTETHPDKLVEVKGVFTSEDAAQTEIKKYQAEDLALTASRGYPGLTLYHYTVSGPFQIPE